MSAELRRDGGGGRIITVVLLTPHVEYLQSAAKWGRTTLSGALSDVLERHTPAPETARKPVHQVKSNLSITAADLAKLNGLVALRGLTRSAVVRQLIEDAIEADACRHP